MSDRKEVIKNVDITEEMQQDCAIHSLEKYNIEKE